MEAARRMTAQVSVNLGIGGIILWFVPDETKPAVRRRINWGNEEVQKAIQQFYDREFLTQAKLRSRIEEILGQAVSEQALSIYLKRKVLIWIMDFTGLGTFAQFLPKFFKGRNLFVGVIQQKRYCEVLDNSTLFWPISLNAH